MSNQRESANLEQAVSNVATHNSTNPNEASNTLRPNPNKRWFMTVTHVEDPDNDGFMPVLSNILPEGAGGTYNRPTLPTHHGSAENTYQMQAKSKNEQVTHKPSKQNGI